LNGISLKEFLSGLLQARIESLHERWIPERSPPSKDGIERLIGSMCDPDRLARRLEGMDPFCKDLLKEFVASPDGVRTHEQLLRSAAERGVPQQALEARLEELADMGLVFPLEDDRWDRYRRPAWGLGRELVTPLQELLRSPGGSEREGEGPAEAGPLTLKAFLGDRHFRKTRRGDGDEETREKSARHARQAYKLFLMPGAIRGRLRRLAAEDRCLVETTAYRFGGLLPRTLAERALDPEEGALLGPELGKRLEESLTGTWRNLDLRAYGIDLAEPTLILFQEITLALLRRRASEGERIPAKEVVAGVDLATNVMRFLRYVDENGVRYTVKGEVFKATQKRIQSRLVTVEGGEDPEGIFRFIFRFCRQRRWIDRSGERTFRLGAKGRSFEALALPDKLRDLLAFAVEDPDLGGDPFHQTHLRRILLRLLRRIEPGRWYDAMYLPHLARNTYLSQLDALGVAEWFAAAKAQGRYLRYEDLVQMSWHLFHWVRHRLHLLGIVDLGFDEGGMPVALRLSDLGSSLLATQPAQGAEGARSTLVVNPDFEILLFPEADAFELVHTLDRFSRRRSSDRVFRFQLSEESVRSALADGMTLGEILRVLSERCRTPLPQNVRFSIRDWGDRAGILYLGEDGRLRTRRREVMDALCANSRVRELCGERLGAREMEFGDRVSRDEFRRLVRDLGFHLESGRPPESSSSEDRN